MADLLFPLLGAFTGYQVGKMLMYRWRDQRPWVDVLLTDFKPKHPDEE